MSSLFSSKVSEVSLSGTSDFGDDGKKEEESPSLGGAARRAAAIASRKRQLPQSDEEVLKVQAKKQRADVVKNDAFVEIIVQKKSTVSTVTNNVRSLPIAIVSSNGFFHTYFTEKEKLGFVQSEVDQHQKKRQDSEARRWKR